MSLPETPLAAFKALLDHKTHHPAMLWGGVTTSFGDLNRMSLHFRRTFIENGVRAGTGVVLSAPNAPWVAAAVLATWDMGAYPVFVSPHAPAGHVTRAESLTHAACVLTEDSPDTGDDTLDDQPLTPSCPEDIASVVFTSGSTGEPKSVMQSGSNLLSGAMRVGRLIGYGSDDRILCPVPFSHDYGWGQLLSCLCLGQTLVLPDREGMPAICDAISLHRPTVIAGTPAVLAGMVYGISNIRKTDLTSVVKLTSTGSHLSPDLVTDVMALFPNAEIFANYGLSETYRSACLVPGDRKGREAGVGRAIEGVVLVVVDEAGNVMPPDTEGEIVHIGAGTALGYIGDPDRTARVFRGFVYEGVARRGVMTGDIGRIDSEGFLTLIGRRDRLIKTMDVRVSLDEIERTLLASQLLERVAMVDIVDRTLGRKLVAYLVLRSHASVADIKAYARQHLSKYMLPRAWHQVASLPATPSGKVDYPALRTMANDC